MELTNKEWKVFSLTDIFEEIQRGKRLKKDDHIEGNIPYISSTALNNGIDGFIGNNKNVRAFKNCLTIANSGSVGATFYQPFDVVASDHVTKLENSNFNKYIYLFLATIISRLNEKYSFSREINDTRIKKEKILLPITSEGKPDYAFMENYMKQKENELLDKYEEHISLRIKSLQQEKLESDIVWKAFELGNIFKIENCKCSNISLLKNGTTPYVGATNRNNGVLKFVEENKKLITKGNCIAFICDGEGSVGYSIYKNEDFVGSTTVKVGRNKHLNKYNAFFITTVADTVRSKYNFGFKRNETHLKKERILLPTTSKGEPDYMFMENYVKNLEYEKLKEYLKYKKLNISDRK